MKKSKKVKTLRLATREEHLNPTPCTPLEMMRQVARDTPLSEAGLKMLRELEEEAIRNPAKAKRQIRLDPAKPR